MKKRQRASALFLIACLVGPVMAQTQNRAAKAVPATPVQSDAVQPKVFFWGLVLNMAFKFAMQVFSGWLQNKVTSDLSNTSDLNRLLLTSANTAIVHLSDFTPFGVKSVGAVENTVVGEPVKPIKLENGKENYQGVHVAVVGFDGAGAATGIKPVTAGFNTGDRIKLKVLPTFNGLMVIENINPQGVKIQIYPPAAGDAVSVKAGAEIMLPLQADQYFEFAGTTGNEQLLITIRDPRAFGDAASKAEVNRKDESTGSSLVQETPASTYPVIAQSLQLQHGQ